MSALFPSGKATCQDSRWVKKKRAEVGELEAHTIQVGIMGLSWKCCHYYREQKGDSSPKMARRRKPKKWFVSSKCTFLIFST